MAMSAAFVLDGIDVESVLMADSLSPSSTRNQVCNVWCVTSSPWRDANRSRVFRSLFNDWGSLVGNCHLAKHGLLNDRQSKILIWQLERIISSRNVIDPIDRASHKLWWDLNSKRSCTWIKRPFFLLHRFRTINIMVLDCRNVRRHRNKFENNIIDLF